MITRMTTELDAVNVCLRAVGEAPVNIIPTSGVSEATIALDVLTETSREVQGRGLHCNTDTEYPITPDTDGFINIPSNVLELDANDVTLDYVQRGQKLYDRTRKVFTFEGTQYFDITWFLDFKDLPEHVRHYIAIKAARTFQRNYLGSVDLDKLSAKDEQDALVAFQRGEDKADDRTILQSYPANLILRRRI